MATITIATATIEPGEGARTPDQAELAAVAFLPRYSGRTLDAYRHDLRNLFQWTAGHDLALLEAHGLISSSTALPWRSVAWPLRRSTADCRQRAATTASRTSTAASPPTRPSTCAVRRSIPPSAAEWTALNWTALNWADPC